MARLEPLPATDWTPAHAAHLLNRAGFGGSPEELDTWHRRGLAGAVEHLVNYDAIPYDPAPPAFVDGGPLSPLRPSALRALEEAERRRRWLARRRENLHRILQLRTWWFQRMRHSPRPLEEKLTLFWHGQLPTGLQKVRSADALYQYQQTLRRLASGSWEDLLLAVTRDPAMLLYLDGLRNTRRAPNENYARELMELFTLGEGHYAETDVREAARALTGWSLNPRTGVAAFYPRRHDPGAKTLLGRTGRFDDADVVRILLDQPRAAVHQMTRMWEFFAYPDPEPELIDALAADWRAQDYQIKPVLKTLFTSRAFYGERAVRTQIKSPVHWLIGISKMLETPLPPPILCHYATGSLGQTLFDPPNVKGWEGGTAWITTDSLIHRYNLAAVLVEGGDALTSLLDPQTRRFLGGGILAEHADPAQELAFAERRSVIRAVRRTIQSPPLDPERVLAGAHRASAERTRRHLQWRLFQAPLRAQDRDAFDTLLASLPAPRRWREEDLRQVLRAMMSTPQFQLT